MKADGEKIHSLIKENLDHFKAEEDSEDWKNYVNYLDDLVVDGLYECVSCSLKYFLENMDKEKSSEEAPPLMEAKFELQVGEGRGRGGEGGGRGGGGEGRGREEKRGERGGEGERRGRGGEGRGEGGEGGEGGGEREGRGEGREVL